jgi:CubicO group peptidase (beta-lactamase class C family)
LLKRTLRGFWVVAFLSAPVYGEGHGAEVARKLQGFDAYMQATVREWNAVGIGVGVVVGDQLAFVRGYGYRDYGKKLPVTGQTLFQIASNTKLFTAVAAGLLVEEGKLTWDEPVRAAVPSIQFYSDSLNNSVTLRDMLAHRTGITRHDSIWYKSEFSSEELFRRLRFLEPSAPPRQIFLYNNMMYAGVGRIVELASGKPWQDYVRERLLTPLGMHRTTFSVADMLKQSDHGVPYDERRDSTELYQVPYYEDTGGLAAAGSMVSDIENLSHWLIALMNDGMYEGRQALSSQVLKETLAPGIAQANTAGEARGWWELQNVVYGMGRRSASYRGHLLTYHGGSLPGFYSQVSSMPLDHIGVIVFTIGSHTAPLADAISYNLYERLLGMSQTPWTKRLLEVRQKNKRARTEGRAKAGAARVANTRPSHALADYVGEYENPAYGILKIDVDGDQLQFNFHKIRLPLRHFHYDRFDTPDDEQDGLWSVNFGTDPLGDISSASLSLDEAQTVFVRRRPAPAPELLAPLAGHYETSSGERFQVVLQPEGKLQLLISGRSARTLIPYEGLKFHVPEFSDVVYEFLMSEGRVTAIKQTDPTGEYVSRRK